MSEEFSVLGFIDNFRSFQNGDIAVRVRIESEEDKRRFLRTMAATGTTVALFRLEQQAAGDAHAKRGATPKGGDKGSLNAMLFKHGFFKSELVAAATGSDEEFLCWIRMQECHFCGAEAEPAHIRSVAQGAGMGIKPPHCAIPMCRPHHMIEHEGGEAVAAHGMFEGVATGEEAKEMLLKLAIRYREKWVAMTLASRLGFDSWTEVTPQAVIRWVAENNLPSAILPAAYRDAAENT